MRYDERQADPDATHGMPAGDGRGDPAEAAMARVIEAALEEKPRRGAASWYPVVVEELADDPAACPSLNRFRSRLAAERSRRRACRLERSATAAALVGSLIGDRQVAAVPSRPTIGREAFEMAVSALTALRSASIGDAYRDYTSASFRARRPSVSKEEFRMIVFSHEVVDSVPGDLLPDWWTRGRARLAGGRP